MIALPRRLFKEFVPESGIKRIREIKELIPEIVAKFFSRNPKLSSLFYGLKSPAFRREHHGVIYGKLKYYESLNSPGDTNYLLRRNIHRLEKGLIMKPRRDVFALEYIEETVDSYVRFIQDLPEQEIDDELKWARDVLTEYFSAVKAVPTIDVAKRKFLQVKKLDKSATRVPYFRNLNAPSPVSYENLLELSYLRRSVRWYLPEPVPRDLIDKAISVAALSPSACNRQPFEFRVFDDPEMVKKVASIPGGTKGFNHNFPTIIVVVGKLRAYFSERDRHIIYIDGSLASMSLLYALETLGLSSCCINWPDVDEPEKAMTALLNLEPDERVVMLISVGYPDPDGMVPFSQKKSLNEIRRYN